MNIILREKTFPSKLAIQRVQVDITPKGSSVSSLVWDQAQL